MVSDELICVCMDVSKQTIADAIKEKELKTVEEVGDETDAGTNCGACMGEIEDILTDLNGD